MDKLTINARVILTIDGDTEAAERIASSTPGIVDVERQVPTSLGGETFSITLADASQTVPVLIERLVNDGLKILEIRQTRPSLIEAISQIAEEDNVPI